MPDNPLLTYWYFHIPNYLLAILMYMALGRLVLSFFFSAGSTNVIYKSFCVITDPVVIPVRAITPLIAPHQLVLLFTFFWMFLIRVVFAMVMTANDLIPTVPG